MNLRQDWKRHQAKRETDLRRLNEHKTPARRVLGRLMGLLLPLWLAGCAVGDAVVGTAISAADKADSAMLRSRGNRLLAEHLKMIDELRAKGDPLGDYLWVVANAEGQVDNPELDPEKLFAMYRAAAENGSTDALVAVGTMLFSGATTPNGTGKNTKKFPHDRLDMKKGLELIEQGTRERCWYWEPIIQTISSQNCLRPIIPSTWVWGTIDSGYFWPRDEALANYWKRKSLLCKQDPAYRRASQHCN